MGKCTGMASIYMNANFENIITYSAESPKRFHR